MTERALIRVFESPDVEKEPFEGYTQLRNSNWSYNTETREGILHYANKINHIEIEIDGLLDFINLVHLFNKKTRKHSFKNMRQSQ